MTTITMSGFKDSDNIENLRDRLYQRGTPGVGSIRHRLTADAKDVPTDWHTSSSVEAIPTTSLEDMVPDTYEPVLQAAIPTMKKNKKHGYRIKLALLGVAFFGVAMIVSSLFMLFGSNSISGDNISIAVTVPFTVSGGDILPIQVGLTNQNSVPMEAATLIIEYPAGTKSDDENARDLFTERISLDTIEPGQTVNMPLRARVFGEENTEKTLKASVEYRVEGSSARFFKEAEPQTFVISSAPVSVRVDGLQRVSSGQETSLTLTVTSNSQSPLSEVLVKAEYPNGFDFERSSPEPDSGRNAWIITDIAPQSSHTITVTGTVTGQDNDTHVLKFSAGTPSERDKNNFAAIFANAETSFQIEQAFIDIGVDIDGSSDRVLSVAPNVSASGQITINNTLSNSIYDVRVVVKASGSAYANGVLTGGSGGFFDSTTNTLTWDQSTRSQLAQMRPNATNNISFTVRPLRTVAAEPYVDVKVDVYARRVSESNVAEELLGSVERTVRVSGLADLQSSASHDAVSGSHEGPIPPEADTPTTYTLSYRIESSTSGLSNARVLAPLPLYVTWLDETTGDGRFEYNQTNRTLIWDVGSVAANSDAAASFEVSLLPSTSQIGTTPTLLGRQTLTATDSFTGGAVNASGEVVTTELASEVGFPSGNGRVEASR